MEHEIDSWRTMQTRICWAGASSGVCWSDSSSGIFWSDSFFYKNEINWKVCKFENLRSFGDMCVAVLWFDFISQLECELEDSWVSCAEVWEGGKKTVCACTVRVGTWLHVCMLSYAHNWVCLLSMHRISHPCVYNE